MLPDGRAAAGHERSRHPSPRADHRGLERIGLELAREFARKDTGVTVTSLMPGPTETEFFERADMEDTKVGSSDKDDPADVARDGFKALMNGDERVVLASLSTKLQGRGSRFMPDSLKAKMHRSMAEPGSGDGE